MRYIFAAGLLFSFQFNLWAVGNMKIGRTEIHPYINTQTKYDDNVYLDADNEKASSIITITPGLNLKHKRAKTLFILDYSLDIINYSVRPDTNNVTHQTISAALDLNFAGGLSIKIKDVYRDTTDPAFSESTERIDRIQNHILTEANYSFGKKFALGMGYSNMLYDYDSETYKKALNRGENVITSSLFYHFLPKTSFLLEHKTGTIDYEDSTNKNDSTYSQVSLGIKGKLTSRITTLIKAGQQARKYDVSISTKDFEGVVFSLQLTRNSSNNTLQLSGSRSIVESTYGTNKYYNSTKINLEVTQKMNSKITMVGGLGYEQIAYPEVIVGKTEKRGDDILQGKIGLNYEIQNWLSIEIEHKYRNRDSNVSGYDYKSNITGFALKMIF